MYGATNRPLVNLMAETLTASQCRVINARESVHPVPVIPADPDLNAMRSWEDVYHNAHVVRNPPGHLHVHERDVFPKRRVLMKMVCYASRETIPF